MWVHRSKLRLRAILVGLCLLALGSAALAQGGAVPVQIGQNTSGTLTAESNTAQFALTAAGGETALIQVLALSPGFAPRFHVLNPVGIEILTISNPAGQAIVTGQAVFDDAGVYTIVIEGENGSSGQFVLSLQAGAALPEPAALVAGQAVSATVGGQTPIQVYRFETLSAEAAAVTVTSQTSGSGALVTLYDEGAGKTIASSDAGVIRVNYRLPADGRRYRVEVRAGEAGQVSYSICLGTCGGGLSADAPTLAVPATLSAAPTTEAAICSATSSAGGAVNLRSGPGTRYAILGGLPLGQTAQVLGQWTGGSWYEVSANGQLLWAAASVVSLSGDCTSLPALAAPTNALLAPTQTPTITPSLTPSPTPMATDTPTLTPMPMLPDLAVQGMTITQDSPTHARVTFDIYNRGVIDVTQPFYVYVCITTLCVEKQITLPVRAGGSTNVFVDLNHPSSNVPETVAVAVDSRGEIRELSEDNNTTSLSDVSLSF